MASYYESPPKCVFQGLPIIVEITQHLAVLLKYLEQIDTANDLHAEVAALRSDSQHISDNIRTFVGEYKLCKQEHLILADAQGILGSIMAILDRTVQESQEPNPTFDDVEPTLDHAVAQVQRFVKDTDNWYKVNAANINKVLSRLPPVTAPTATTPMAAMTPMAPVSGPAPNPASFSRRFSDINGNGNGMANANVNPNTKQSRAWKFIKTGLKYAGYVLLGILVVGAFVASLMVRTDLTGMILNSNQSTAAKVIEIGYVDTGRPIQLGGGYGANGGASLGGIGEGNYNTEEKQQLSPMPPMPPPRPEEPYYYEPPRAPLRPPPMPPPRSEEPYYYEPPRAPPYGAPLTPPMPPLPPQRGYIAPPYGAPLTPPLPTSYAQTSYMAPPYGAPLTPPLPPRQYMAPGPVTLRPLVTRSRRQRQ